ncbi:MAG: type 4a pilus biogenesis protein PilO [Gammaproteobacteria bacterium]|nr:type 4a pilus biogenesis protein PilO [Gammaproteobacteria bacterium]
MIPDTWLQSRKSWLALFTAVLLVFLLVLFNVLFKDAWQQKRQLADSYNNVQRQLDQTKALESLNLEREEISSELESIRKKLYFRSEGRNSAEIVPYVIGILDDISARFGVRLEAVKPLEVHKVLMLEEMPFDITISGPYKNIYRWLGEAEEALNPMAVKNFTINPYIKGQGVIMKMRVVSYRLPMEKG